MLGVNVTILRLVEPAYPGWVECNLTDASGRDWRFVEKAPVVSQLDLDEASVYPQRGVIACEIVGRGRDKAGREIVRVDTTQPWGVESVEGVTQFEIFAELLVEC